MKARLSPAFQKGADRRRSFEELFSFEPTAINDVVVAVDKEFTKHEDSLFKSEGAAAGIKWAPLSPAYKRWKDRLFGQAISFNRGVAKERGGKFRSGFRGPLGAENKILTLTGDMRRAFTDSDNPEHIAMGFRSTRGWTVRVGAASEIARYHAEGTATMPERPPIMMNKLQRDRHIAVANRALVPHVLSRLRAISRIGRRA